jgi:hypothetical protein
LATIRFALAMAGRQEGFFDAYRVLGLSQGAGKEEIKRVARDLFRECHPDKGGSAELFDAVRKASQILLNDAQRAEHDDARAERAANLDEDDDDNEHGVVANLFKLGVGALPSATLRAKLSLWEKQYRASEAPVSNLLASEATECSAKLLSLLQSASPPARLQDGTRAAQTQALEQAVRSLRGNSDQLGSLLTAAAKVALAPQTGPDFGAVLPTAPAAPQLNWPRICTDAANIRLVIKAVAIGADNPRPSARDSLLRVASLATV